MTAGPVRARRLDEPPVVRAILIGAAVAFLFAFLVAPLAIVFVKAISGGLRGYASAVTERYAVDAIKLTLTVAAIVVPLNFLYGLAAAWAVSKFDFPGKTVLTTLIDLPLSVSPVISGMLFVLLFGAHGWFGPWLIAHGVKIVFALPGIVLATLFVTAPLVARELIPVLQAQGSDEEEAALTLGASGLKTFWHVSLPKMRWGLLYGTVLCTARAMGEFGAVSVVSGHIRGRTTTLPLQVEMLYNEYAFTAAFAVASLLAAVALASLAVQAVLGRSEGART